MATISITVPDAVVARVLDAIAAQYGYDATRDGTKAQFAKAILARFMKEVVVAYEATAAGEASRKAAEDKAKTEVSVT